MTSSTGAIGRGFARRYFRVGKAHRRWMKIPPRIGQPELLILRSRLFAPSVRGEASAGMTTRKPKILLSEGSSLSSREAITALGLAGHRVELLTSDPMCLGRFSRFVSRVHQ